MFGPISEGRTVIVGPMTCGSSLVLMAERPSQYVNAARRVPALRAPWFRGLVPGPFRGAPDGPTSVLRNLIAGLAMHGCEPFVVDGNGPCPDRSIVGVLSGQRNAEAGSALRRSGRVEKLLVGPNVAVLPSLALGPCWEDADCVLVPSPWVARLYSDDMPAITSKLRVWAAGVDTEWWVPGGSARNEILVYDKRQDGTADDICSMLRRVGLRYRIVRYGRYYPDEFRMALQVSGALVWVGGSESQGLGMFEAWSCDVPTVVLGDVRSQAPPYMREYAEAAPYLTTDRGVMVDSAGDVPDAVRSLLAGARCEPRASVVSSCGLAASAHAYLHIACGRPPSETGAATAPSVRSDGARPAGE